MLRFDIDNTSPVPVHQQVKQSILIEMISGRLNNGDRLPPIRELAKILKLNPNTVAKVYYNLVDEGYIIGKMGSGYTVKYHKSKLDSLRLGILEDEFKNFLQKAFAMGFVRKDIEDLMRRLLNHE
jgi:GntR family transcriptional regulator